MHNSSSCSSSHEACSCRFQVRKLEISDTKKGFIELLQQLSVCRPIPDTKFQRRYREITSFGDDHVVCVVEDDCSGKIVGAGSVFIEKKFLRNCGKVGHIEDVVVDPGARGLQLGKKIIGVPDSSRTFHGVLQGDPGL